LKVHSSLLDVTGPFDIFFSSHVLEHVPSVREAIDFGFRILKPGGIFVAVTPNGSAEFRKNHPSAWHKLWGLVHPNFLDDIFYRSIFADNPIFLSSDPYPMQEIEN
jgi:2-polyprenyl-3-methyl-5-hydroxy-6-metoxy-1,4-benzoquinol methylase